MRTLLQVFLFGGLAVAAHVALVLVLLERTGLPTLSEPENPRAVMLRAGPGIEAMVARWNVTPVPAAVLQPAAAAPRASGTVRAPGAEQARPAPGMVPAAAAPAPAEVAPAPLAPLPPRLRPSVLVVSSLLQNPATPQTERVRLRLSPAPVSVRVPAMADHGQTAVVLPATPPALIPLRGTAAPPPRPAPPVGAPEPETAAAQPSEVSPRAAPARPVPEPAAPEPAAPAPAAPEPAPPEPVDSDMLLASWVAAITERVEAAAPTAPGLRTPTSVVVRLLIAADGQIIEAGLVGSSGNEQLDSAALDAVSRAGSVPPAPPGLDAALVTFDIPLLFTR